MSSSNRLLQRLGAEGFNSLNIQVTHNPNFSEHGPTWVEHGLNMGLVPEQRVSERFHPETKKSKHGPTWVEHGSNMGLNNGEQGSSKD